MVDEKREAQPLSPNVISAETGQLDVRFVLWRKFCAECGLNVEILPSELSDEQRAIWEKLKETELSAENED